MTDQPKKKANPVPGIIFLGLAAVGLYACFGPEDKTSTTAHVASDGPSCGDDVRPSHVGGQTKLEHYICLNKPMHIPVGMPICSSEDELKYYMRRMPNGCSTTFEDTPAWFVDTGLLGFMGTSGGMYYILRIRTMDAPSGTNVYLPELAVYNVGDDPK